MILVIWDEKHTIGSWLDDGLAHDCLPVNLGDQYGSGGVVFFLERIGISELNSRKVVRERDLSDSLLLYKYSVTTIH